METKIYPKKWGNTIYQVINCELYNAELGPSYEKIENVSYILKTFEHPYSNVVEIRTPNKLINNVFESDLEKPSIDGWLASTEENAKKLLQQKINDMLRVRNAQLIDLISSVKSQRQVIAKLKKALTQLNNNKSEI